MRRDNFINIEEEISSQSLLESNSICITSSLLNKTGDLKFINNDTF